MRQTGTKKLTVLAMLSVMAYLVMFVGRIPMISFLKYDPKDVIIVISGFLYGPLAAFAVSGTVSFIEMITVSSTGWIGFAMNVVSSCSFACTAAFIYKRKRSLKGAAIALAAGALLATAVMLLWNYMLTPIFMEQSREEVAAMLLPVFLPFNLLKGTINSALATLLYKPLTNALRSGGLLSPQTADSGKKQGPNWGVILLSLFVLLTSVLVVLVIRGVF